jgi:serine carboxypeptidase-like clade 2
MSYNFEQAKIFIFLCSGDQDSVIPLLGTRSLVNGLAKDFGLNTTASYRAWFNERQVNIWNVLNFTIR